MSYTDPSVEDINKEVLEIRRRQRPYYKWIALAIAVLLVVVFLNQKPFVNPKIKAEAYVWPQGCEKKEYEDREAISPQCEDGRYYIGNGREYGWKRAAGGYYRVGNDAMQITCGFFDKKICKVNIIVEDVFVAGETK